MNRISVSVLALPSLLLVGCASTSKHDLAHHPFPEAQAELREVLKNIINDGETKNVAGLRASHVNTDKFTKFGGRVYDRMNFEECTADETASRLSVESYRHEARDVKIDVFGDVAIMTYYPHVTAKKDGEVIQYSLRQTLVFLKTADGWKIIHEHQSRKKYEE